ncbi:hypothetical protein MRX96_050569 [Rhipicephalus microplus]
MSEAADPVWAPSLHLGLEKQPNTEQFVARRNSVTQFQEMLIFLMRLRLNPFLQDSAYRFRVSQSTVSRSVNKWLDATF